MKSKRKTYGDLIFAFSLVAVALLAARSASALIMVRIGNQPVTDYGWPKGSLALAHLETRGGYWEGPPFGGGEYHFLYRGDNAALDADLKKFAAIHAAALEVVIHNGPHSDQFLAMPSDANRNPDGRVDWSFVVWVPENWNRLYNGPTNALNVNSPNLGKPVAPPRMDVYVGAGGLDWSKVTVPPNLTVRDERAPKQTREAVIDTSRVEQCLRDFESITNGMTRAGVETRLRHDGGLQGASPVRFVHPECPYFKIDVEFDFKRDASDGNRAVENKNDRVVRVSKPYLERPFSD